MLRVSGFGVKNLRSLRDTNWIDIRPINIFVGKNSAGKSSLARVFPLLKQSAERRKQAPLLWYGRLVDFGSFADAVSSFADPKEIELSLRFGGQSLLRLSRRAYYARSERDEESAEGAIDATLTLTEAQDGRTQLRGLYLNVFGIEVRVSFGGPQGDTLQVGGRVATAPSDGRLVWVQGAILPQLRVLFNESAAARVSDDDFSAPRRKLRLGEDDVVDAISHFVHGNTLRERKIEIADRLPAATLEALLAQCRNLPSAPDTWRSSIAAVQPQSYWINELHRALVLFKLDLILAELDDVLSSFCNSVSYLEPLRATAQRYYRREEVSVDEVDPKGLNTAFFVQGLSSRERDSLNDWLQSTFGFKIGVKADRGHTALHIEVDDTVAGGRNMADVGLGYSQLTPVAIQLWAARHLRRPVVAVNRSRFNQVSRQEAQGPLVVVEQPELHLHPAFQAKLADVFVSCVSNASRGNRPDDLPQMRLIAETHSANLIGRLGELVGQGVADPLDINVLVFETDPSLRGATTVRVAEYDQNGVLQNWPIGFFDH